MARHLVAEHLAALVDTDGTAVQRPNVEDRARLAVEKNRAAGVRRHRIEMASVERNALALAGAGDVVDLALRKAGILQHIVEYDARKLDGIALTDANDRARKPSLLAVLHLEQGRLDGAGSNVNAGCYGHGSLPSFCPRCARRANSAAPSAPV